MKTNRNTTKGRTGAKRGTKKATVQAFTEFEGEEYSGLRTSQAWNYGKGQWKEQRTGTQSWDIAFDSIAVKTMKAGTGLPVGSEHHCYVLAHQKLVKTRNNTYQLRMEGVKFKLAHKTSGEKWSANAGMRKKNLIKALKQVLHDLEMGHGQAPSETRNAPLGTEAPVQVRKARRTRKKDIRN